MAESENETRSLRQIATQALLEVWAETGACHLFTIKGSSMLPLLCEGDRVLVAHGRRALRRGDIVLFQREDGLVAHRLLYIQSESAGKVLFTQGDHTQQMDPPLGEAQILGRVTAVRRGERAMWLDTPLWRAVGWLVATMMLLGARMYAAERWLKRHTWGNAPCPATAALRRSMAVGFFWALKAVKRIFWRWKG